MTAQNKRGSVCWTLRLSDLACHQCNTPALPDLATDASGMGCGVQADRVVLTWVMYLSRSLPPRLRRMSSTAICKHASNLSTSSINLRDSIG